MPLSPSRANLFFQRSRSNPLGGDLPYVCGALRGDLANQFFQVRQVDPKAVIHTNQIISPSFGGELRRVPEPGLQKVDGVSAMAAQITDPFAMSNEKFREVVRPLPQQLSRGL